MSSEAIYPRSPKEYDGPKVTNFQTLIKKVNFVWSDLIRIPDQEYRGTNRHIRAICAKHESEFKVTPGNLTAGKGCRECGIRRRALAQRTPIELVEQEIDSYFGEGLYEIDFTDYKNFRSHLPIHCTKHRLTTKKTAIGEVYHHKTPPCPLCDRNNMLKPIDAVIRDFRLVHGEDRYDYSLVEYTGSMNKVKILCNNHQSPLIFEMTPNSHFRRKGCPTCNTGQYHSANLPKDAKDTKALLYLVRVFNETHEFMKYGITRSTVKNRLKHLKIDGFNYEVVSVKNGTLYDVILTEEAINKYLESIKESYKVHLLKESYTHGWTECFNVGVDISVFFND